ncbi:uncharacterized protein MICPUCDRAFT_38768 [Micromonas pusilla CCMP1545]|uniref:Predicted protein n=1 Tax=Micromonas pusilla (strain CCMP1545) TaxID=564608 RepID=C1MLY8_MICPC|nr:uncharacterized protein MICPUCDRAFT_38768 [Micromonas pusilla CCMP1545]EEH58491.1 predicted protein [Micromonas pusilla CCMP1545]|eukprot:XP_003056846.1 predicted protein [Micromonas pusilla CCMP1545]
MALKRGAVVEIEALASGDDGDGPFVIHNPHLPKGRFPSGTTFQAWTRDAPSDDDDSANRRAEDVIVRGRTDGVDYVGKNFLEEKPREADPCHMPTDACVYFVARVRKLSGNDVGGGGGGGVGAGATHAMAIAPVAGGAIFPIETRCHALEYDPPAVTGPVEDMDDPETRRMASARLTAAFSSQKRQRKVARVRAERAVDASTFASSSALQDALAAATANEMSAKQLSELAGANRNIPGHDVDATNPSDAFPFELFPLLDLLDRTRWKDLSEASKKPSKMKELEADGHFDAYTLSLVPKIAEGTGVPGGDKHEESRRRKLRAKSLAALDFLIKFYVHKGVVVERREKKRKGEEEIEIDSAVPKPWILLWTDESKVHPFVQRGVVDAFTELQRSEDGTLPGADEAKRYVRPKRSKDLLCMHVILMALRVCDWTLDVTALGKKMKESLKELIPHCKELGCKLSKEGTAKTGGVTTFATLPLDGTKRLGDFLPEIKRRPQAAKKRE